MMTDCGVLLSAEKWGAGSFFHSKQTKNIAALWKWLVWLLFLCLINPTQSQAQEPADTFVQCGNVALTGSHPFIVGMDTVGMDTEREVTRCSLKTSRLNQPSLSFSSLKNLGLYLYAVLSAASSGRYSPYDGVSTLKQPSLPLPGMPAPGFSSPALFPPGSTQPLNQRERVRPYLIPDNLSTDHIKKLNRAFRHIDQHGTEKPEKGTGVDIYTSFINHKVRQVITLPEHCLTQERTFDLLNHLLEASLNAWLTYYLSISDTPSLIRLIPVFIERAMVMSSGAGGDDWNNGGWITNELNDDTPFSIRIVPFSRTATQWMHEWMQQLITLDMKLKRKLIVLLYDQLHASVLSGNRDLARISRDRIMLIEVETGERLRRISDSGNSAVELSMQAERLITEFLSYTEDVQRHRTLASRNDSHTHSGRRSSAIGLMVNEIERRLEQLSTSSDNNQEVIHQLDSALESLRLQLEHSIHDNDNPANNNSANNNKVVDGDRQPTENSNAGASSTYTARGTAASTSSGHSYRPPTRRLRQSRRGKGSGGGGGGRPPRHTPPRYLNSVTDTAISIVTNLEQNPERLTLDHLISLVEAHGEELLGTRSSNYPENSLLHIICLNKKTDIIEWINLNIRNDYRHTIYHAKNRKNVTPAMLRTEVKRNPDAPVFSPQMPAETTTPSKDHSGIVENDIDIKDVKLKGNIIITSTNKYSALWERDEKGELDKKSVLNNYYDAINNNNFSADGNRIALVRFTGNKKNIDIWERSEDGWVTNSIHASEDIGKLLFNPTDNNEMIVFNSRYEGGATLFKRNETGSWEQQSTLNNHLCHPGSYTPDGKQLILRGNGAVIIFDKNDNDDWTVSAQLPLEYLTQIFVNPVKNEFITVQGVGGLDNFKNANTPERNYDVKYWRPGADKKWNHEELITILGDLKTLHFSPDGNDIVLGNGNKAAIMQRNGDNWETGQKISINIGDFTYIRFQPSPFSQDGKYVFISGCFLPSIYKKTEKGNWKKEYCFGEFDASPILRLGSFSPDNDRALVVVNSSNNGKNNEVVIFQKLQENSEVWWDEVSRRTFDTVIIDATFYLDKEHILVVYDNKIETYRVDTWGVDEQNDTVDPNFSSR